ncbi:MAG: hypothetical protein VYE42_01630, partial [Actinomycetota bacterium]|nr:hypothetical protein [Actinomycetota bacterium]
MEHVREWRIIRLVGIRDDRTSLFFEIAFTAGSRRIDDSWIEHPGDVSLVRRVITRQPFLFSACGTKD